MPPLLRVTELCKTFPVKAGAMSGDSGKRLRAVHRVSFELNEGETLGLVGESGCGKSTTGRLILGLIAPTSGTVELNGEEITSMRGRALHKLRRKMQIVFQDPLGSLNPRLTVGTIIAEPLIIHGDVAPSGQRVPFRRGECRTRVAELLRQVELPVDMVRRYPHQLSGGQRQRVAIARALALRPDLIVADEPVSALDASIQAQILSLFKKLQHEHGLAYLFISHDLAVVRFLSHQVAVMYLGEIVERGPTEEVFNSPAHPYTRALLAAIPKPEPSAKPVQPLSGQVPSATDPPTGCAFASRCPHVMERCRRESPPEFASGPRHSSRCWLNESEEAASLKQ
ncbi:ABC transporter ATP-binding protein [bacterium]|nr:ABC transporter ATP-binding protein [bacterium]